MSEREEGVRRRQTGAKRERGRSRSPRWSRRRAEIQPCVLNRNQGRILHLLCDDVF